MWKSTQPFHPPLPKVSLCLDQRWPLVGMQQQGTVILQADNLVGRHQRLACRLTVPSQPSKPCFQQAGGIEALTGQVDFSLQAVPDGFSIMAAIARFQLAEGLKEYPEPDPIFPSGGGEGLEIWNLQVTELVQ